MKRMILVALSALILAGCMSDDIISGYSKSRMESLLVTHDLQNDGAYGVCKIFVPREEQIEGKIPLLVYFSGEETCAGLNSIVEYIDKDDNPAIVIIVPYVQNDLERSKISRGVADYITSRLKDEASAVSPNQIWVTGFGKGGYEAWRFALDNPALVSTVAPVCGGPASGKKYDEPVVPNQMIDMNVWAIQYIDDPEINNEFSKKIVRSIWNKSLAQARYTEFMKGGHTSEVYSHREFLDWLFGTMRMSYSE